MGFSQGLSGLNASSQSLEVIGNNIANANTVGFKTARAEFADVYANALGGTANNVGIGVSVAAVAQQFTQGTITATDNPLDIAINGGGFFEVKNPAGAVSYTRNGQFKVDRDGFIVNNQAQQLLGYPADATGVIIPGTAVPLQMPTGGITPAVTTKIGMEMNLDARLCVTLPAAGAPIDFADPSTTTTRPRRRSMTPRARASPSLTTSRRPRPTPGTSTSPPTARRSRPGREPRGIDDDHLPEQWRRADGAGGKGRDQHPGGLRRRRSELGADQRRRPRRVAGDPVRLAVRRHRPGAGRIRRRPADRRPVRGQRRRHGALFERRDQGRRPDRDRIVPKPAGAAAARRQRLGADLRLGRPAGRRSRRRQLRRPAGGGGRGL